MADKKQTTAKSLKVSNPTHHAEVEAATSIAELANTTIGKAAWANRKCRESLREQARLMGEVLPAHLLTDQPAQK